MSHSTARQKKLVVERQKKQRRKPVDGTKYYHYREHYIRTGSLRSFGLMMRHYEVAFQDLPPEPVGRRRRPVLYVVN